MRTRIALLASLATTLIAGNVLACGDSLYRVGKGVSYRVYTAPLPGSVLVYGEGEGAELLAKELARSGHGVRLVSNDEELKAELTDPERLAKVAALKPLADGLGAITAITIFYGIHFREIGCLTDPAA